MPFTALVLVSACDQPQKSSVAKGASAQDLVVQDLDKLEAQVRIAAANKRIDELERKVGKLEATPEKLDLDLLSQRVTALEVKANDASALTSEMPLLNERLGSGRPNSSAAQQRSTTQRATARSSALNLPDLEKRPRLATPTEAKAFAPGK